MRRLVLPFMLLLTAPALADTTGVPAGGVARRIVRFSAAPATCNEGDKYYDLLTHAESTCTETGWKAVALAGTVVPATTCTNQFISAIAATGAGTCTALVLAGAQFANQGTTTTVLHGNGAGNPSFAAVVSGDLNITTTTCTNQFVSAISAGGVGTCTTDALASAQHANQGTTTTVLHGAAAGNPSFGAVVDGDLSLTAPALGAPIATTVQTSGNVGIGIAPSATNGFRLLVEQDGNQITKVNAKNTDAASAGAAASVGAFSDSAGVQFTAFGTGFSGTLFGVNLAGQSSLNNAGVGTSFTIGSTGATPVRIGTNGTAAIAIDTSQNTTFAGAIIPSQTLGVTGTTTNNNANAGAVGEYVTAVCPGPATTATITVTIASPAVVTWTSHPFSGTAPRFDACPVVFTTTGALPTGITASTNYWVIPSTISGNNFQIATSVANAISATAVNTSGSQSGTQTGTAGTVLSTGATSNISGLALTAGDWDCTGATNFSFGATTSITNLTGGISTTTATLPAQDSYFDFETAANVPTATAVSTWVIPTVRSLLSGTTNHFLTTQATFTLSTLKAGGSIRCRRMR